MNYEQLEQDLSDRLAGYFFDCKPLPEAQVDFKSSFKPQVYVMFDSSDFTETENVSVIVQEDKLKVGFELHARTRRGDEGIFAIQRVIFKRIIGLKLSGYDKMQLLSFTPLQGNKPNEWAYYIQFVTTTHVSESESESEEPLLKQVTFIPPDE